jgi:hypothetical protein
MQSTSLCPVLPRRRKGGGGSNGGAEDDDILCKDLGEFGNDGVIFCQWWMELARRIYS